MKILAMVQPGTVSRGLIDDIIWGFEEIGHDVLRMELAPIWAMRDTLGQDFNRVAAQMGEHVLDLIDRNGVDFSFAMWGNGTKTLPIQRFPDGTLRPVLDLRRQPHLHFWWDAPHWWNNGGEVANVDAGFYRGEHQFHYINNPATGTEMSSLMGFRNVIPMPNGVNPNTFRPHPATAREYDLAFVSGVGDPPPTPVMLEELESDDPDVDRIRKDLATQLLPEIAALATGFGGAIAEPMRRLLEGMVEARLAYRHEPAAAHLQRVAQSDENLTVAAQILVNSIPTYIRATDLIRRIDKWERPFMVAYLSRHFKCLRLGQQSYDEWGIEGDATGLIDYHRQSELYAKAKFALNVMRWQDDIGLNSKIFEITASGSPLLQAYRTGVDDLFENGREIMVSRTPGEARRLLADALNTPGRAEEIAEAGRRRTLRDHTWARRMAVVEEVMTEYWRDRGREVEPTIRIADGSVEAKPESIVAKAGQVSRTGHRLAFIIAPMRSGSTLLRRMLDAHGRLVSPPETWFLAPLLNLWNGVGQSPHYNLHQAAVALQTVADRPTFVDSCRAFASELYSRLMTPDTECVIDKTPLYLSIVDQAVELFPDARFIILARDPRATVWSFHTWEKTPDMTVEGASHLTAQGLRKQWEFVTTNPDRCMVLRYEDLCADPETWCRRVCTYLGVEFDPSMIEYGRHADARPGYGDEKTQEHVSPHVNSLRRWEADEDGRGLPVDQQLDIAARCGAGPLGFFGYGELGCMLEAEQAGSV